MQLPSNLDALIVTNPYNILYLAGFKGISDTEREAVLIVAKSDLVLITARLYQTEANISRQLKELKRHGLVNISANKKDKRQKDVSLSREGKKKYDRAQKLIAGQHSQLLRLLSKNELKTFEHGIHNLITAFGGPSSSR